MNPKNRTDIRLSEKQFTIISLMADGWRIKQHGRRTAYLVKYNDGVENFCQRHVTSIGVPTMKILLKKKLIELDARVTLQKQYKLSQKGESSLLSLLN